MAISASIKQPVGVTLAIGLQCNCYPICGQDSSDLQDLSSISCASKNKKGEAYEGMTCFVKLLVGTCVELYQTE